MASHGPNLYQSIRTVVKKQLNHVVELVGMEYAIRAATDEPLEEAESALRSHLNEHGFHVIAEIDVQEIHHHYDLEYPKFKILKLARAPKLMACPMAGRTLELDTGSSSLLPPSVILYETEDETRVSAIRPTTLLALFDNQEVREIVVELEGVLWDALDDAVPGSRMLSNEPPIRSLSDRQARIKKLLHPVLNLLDAEYSFHLSTPAGPGEVEAKLRDSLTLRGQHVVGEVGDRETTVLLAINPGQAHKLLAIEPDIAVFAPLSVGIYLEGDRIHVQAVRASTLLIFFTNPAIQDILLEMEILMWNALCKGVPEGTVHSRQPPLVGTKGQSTTGAGLPGGLDSFRKYRPS